jgi:hypothetical protein
LYVPPGDVGFWQAGIRDPADPDYAAGIGELSDEEAEAQLAAELAALEQMDIHVN